MMLKETYLKFLLMKTFFKQTAFFLFLLPGLIFATLASAQKPGKGNKNVIKVDHEVNDFSAIKVGSAFNVIVEKYDSSLVKIETDENLQNQITVVVENGTLIIGSKGISNPSALNAYVFYTGLVSVDISSAATLKSSGPIVADQFSLSVSGAAQANTEFDVEQLDSNISGASTVKIKGKANLHNTEVSGASGLNAVNLLTSVTKAKVSGAAKAKVTATDKIDCDISGAARLEYFNGKSVVSTGKTGKYSIYIDEDINIDSLNYAEVPPSNYSDSVSIRIGNFEIEVYDGDNTRVKVGNAELEVDESGRVAFKKGEKKAKFNGHWAGFDIGINGYLTSGGKLSVPNEYSFLDLRYEKAINVQVNVFEQNFALAGNKFGLVTGLGLEWNNYRFDNDVKLDISKDKIAHIPLDGIKSTKSKLTVLHLNVPLFFEYQTNSKNNINSFHISAGVVGGVKIGSHSKNVYENGGRRKEKQRDDFYLNPLSLDVMLRVGWGKLNLYGNYSLLPLFRENRGPELYPFSIGITILSF